MAMSYQESIKIFGRERADSIFKGAGLEVKGKSIVRDNKFGNVRTQGSASKKESKRLQELQSMDSLGLISDLEYQVVFWILPNFEEDGQKIRGIKYIADFVYQESGKTKKTIEDSKGYPTPEFKLKWKFMRYQYQKDYYFKIS